MYILNISTKRGFTLIELLVVIAIIGLLAGIVLASLSSARGKANDVAVIAMVGEFQKLLELNNNDYGSYTKLQPGAWYGSAQNLCSTIPAGNYQAQAISICNAIITKCGAAGTCFELGNTVDNAQKYSIMTWLPYMQKFYCLGSSGAISYHIWGGEDGTWSFPYPGCKGNP